MVFVFSYNNLHLCNYFNNGYKKTQRKKFQFMHRLKSNVYTITKHELK